MPSLTNIFSKAFAYTKNHRFLWFFGFFMTSSAILNLVKFWDVDWSSAQKNFMEVGVLAQHNPRGFYFMLAGVLVFIASILLIGAISKASIISATAALENKEQIGF